MVLLFIQTPCTSYNNFGSNICVCWGCWNVKSIKVSTGKAIKIPISPLATAKPFRDVKYRQWGNILNSCLVARLSGPGG